VEIKLVSGLNSRDLSQVVGQRSEQVAESLGPGARDIVARPEDIVFIDEKDR
jgi:hypothetical protein